MIQCSIARGACSSFVHTLLRFFTGQKSLPCVGYSLFAQIHACGKSVGVCTCENTHVRFLTTGRSQTAETAPFVFWPQGGLSCFTKHVYTAKCVYNTRGKYLMRHEKCLIIRMYMHVDMLQNLRRAAVKKSPPPSYVCITVEMPYKKSSLTDDLRTCSFSAYAGLPSPGSSTTGSEPVTATCKIAHYPSCVPWWLISAKLQVLEKKSRSRNAGA